MFTARPTDSGAQITLVLNDVTELDVHVVVAGDQLRLPSLPVAIGNGDQLRMSAGWSTEGTLVDEDGDGVADSARAAIKRIQRRDGCVQPVQVVNARALSSLRTATQR